MDRFEKDSREIPFIAQGGHLDEIAAWGRKLYADARREMAREVKEHYADGEETLSEFYEWLEAKAKGA
jgi:hypothetical protein